MLKTVVMLNIFMEAIIYIFQDSWLTENWKDIYLKEK